MINVDGLTTSILNELSIYTGVKVIFSDQGGKKPKGDYITIKVLSSHNKTGDHDIEIRNVVSSEDPNFENDIEYSYISTPEIVISLTIYGDERFDVAQKAREWFSINKLNKDTISAFSAIVKDVTAIKDRDIMFAGMTYERKQGFDVVLVVQDTIKIIEDTIETIVIKDGGVNE